MLISLTLTLGQRKHGGSMKFVNLWKYKRDTDRNEVTLRFGSLILFSFYYDSSDRELAVVLCNFKIRVM
jgi:hypothetical protein